MNKRLTSEQKKQIKLMKDIGRKNIEIAKEIGVSIKSVIYWSNEEQRNNIIRNSMKWFNKLSDKRKKETRKKRKEYLRKYVNKKYKEDSVFKEKQKERMRNYMRKIRGNKNNIIKTLT